MSERNRGLERTTLDGEGTATGVAAARATPALTILYHPHLERVGERALLVDLASEGGVSLSRMELDFAAPGRARGEPLGDEHLSRKPIRLLPASDGGVRLELGDSSTAVLVRGKRVQRGAHFPAAMVRRGVVLELGHRIVLLLHAVASLQGVLGGPDGELIGDSDGIRQVLWEIRSVADLTLPVLLRGETGSGKELVARAIHRTGPRRDAPFVAVNLGAITPTLAASELFGAERGAHSAASRRQPGYVEQARGGTLFLDEIGEAPLELQVALLRFLETGEIQSVGAQVRRVDVRVVAATDADLEAKVTEGTFRAPLLNRLSAFEIAIPPLRARRDDVGRLLVRFLREELAQLGESDRLLPPPPERKPWLPASLVARLADHDWPGNVRQLRNVVRQLVIGSRGRDRIEITPALERLLSEPPPSGRRAPPDEDAAAGAPPAAPESAEPVSLIEPVSLAAGAPLRSPAELTEGELAEALRASRWDLAATAQRLGISRTSLYRLMEQSRRFRTARDLSTDEIVRCHRECSGDLRRMVDELQVSERALARRVRELKLE